MNGTQFEHLFYYNKIKEIKQFIEIKIISNIKMYYFKIRLFVSMIITFIVNYLSDI